jgi:hypothetical protein
MKDTRMSDKLVTFTETILVPLTRAQKGWIRHRSQVQFVSMNQVVRGLVDAQTGRECHADVDGA